MAVTVLWVSPQFWSTCCCHMLFNSWGFPNCCLAVEDGTTSSVSSGEPGPNNALLQTTFRMFEGAYSYYFRNFLNCRGRFCWFLEYSLLIKSVLLKSNAALSPGFHRPSNQRDGADSPHPHVRHSSSSYIPAQTQSPSLQDAQDTLSSLGKQLAAQSATLSAEQLSQFPRDSLGVSQAQAARAIPRMRPSPQPHPRCWGVRMLHPLQLLGNSQADG